MLSRGTPHDHAVLFRQDRRKIAGVGVLSIAFVAMGISFITDPDLWKTAGHSAGSIEEVGWITAPFFSLVLIGAAVALVRPVTVALGPDGVTVSTVWRTCLRPWGAIGNFRIRSNNGIRMVVFDDAAPPNPRLAELNRRISGATSSLPTCLNVSPEQLLASIQAAKDRWAAGATL